MKRLVAIALVTAAATGCGYTKEEYQLQGDKLTRALAKQRAADSRSDEVAAELEASKERVTELEERMRALGIDLTSGGRIGDAAANLAERERALAEYRAKAARVEEARARMALLRSKLETLADAGVEVRVRKNRMMLVLPDALLFEGNKLKKEGREALKTIAGILKDDPVLTNRDYQIAAHTDVNPKAKGQADTVGPTLARAKSVLTFLTDPKDGALDRGHFSAAGYGDVEPIAPNDTDDGRQKNRRVELVIVPTTGEMLDLRALSVDAAGTRR